MAFLVDRTCTEVVKGSGARVSKPFRERRSRGAYVLLGDPGSGKTQTFRAEAEACDGFYIPAREFLTLPLPIHAQGKTLFIDGLDECRAGEGDGRTPLDRIRGVLDRLGKPLFRLSCREIDWLGASDRHALAAVAPMGEVSVFHLDQLTDDQIRCILQNNPSIIDAETFLSHAEEKGLGPLLYNPQTLGLLVEAVSGSEWPTTRQETFQLACEKLAAELNGEHRSAGRWNVPTTSELLHAAGGLCAVVLLADVSGFTETGEGAGNIIAMRDIACLKDLPVAYAARTRLFMGIGEEHFAPIHRSVAEYLAARFLAQVMQSGLPISRVLSLITGEDGGTVAGLRGLNAWLSVHHLRSRRQLIEMDPLGAILYGDTKLFSVEDKAVLLTSLHGLARQYTGFRWQDWSAKPFGALATPDMVEHLRSILASPSRDEGDQAFLACVLDAIRYGDPLPQLKDALRAAVMDTTRWATIRNDALSALMHVANSTPEELRQIADDIRDGKIEDPEDEMLGRLLRKLFPHTIRAGEVFTYMHHPKNISLVGSYLMFWAHGIGKVAENQDVPILLDALAANKAEIIGSRMDLSVRNLIGRLLHRGVRDLGGNIPDSRLYRWLGIAVDKYDSPCIEQDESTAIRKWLEAHPHRYKGLLSAGIRECADNEDFKWCASRVSSRLFDARPPEDLGYWWLIQAIDEPDQRKADNLFYMATECFFSGHAAAGLSLDFFKEWVEARPRFAPAYQQTMSSEIPDWRRRTAERTRTQKEEQQKQHNEWMEVLRRHLPEIHAGTGDPKVLHLLANVYFGLQIGVHGETPLERLSNFLNNDADLISAAISGFQCSLERPDLPTVREILKSSTHKRMYYILYLACLAGVTEIYRTSPSRVLELSEEVLSKTVAFQYTSFSNDPDWFKFLLDTRPELVAKVLIEYAGLLLRTKHQQISGIESLAHKEEYAKVARLAVVPLLHEYPIRATKKRASNILGYLLKAALLHLNDDEIKELVDERLAVSAIDTAQRVYWLAAGLIVAPSDYASKLADFTGKRRERIQYLASFFSNSADRWLIREAVHEPSLAYLVRTLGPICSPYRPRGGYRITPDMYTAEFVHSLISRLGGAPTSAAKEVINELLNARSLIAWQSPLRHALHTQQVSYRETTFGHPTVRQVCETLRNLYPANVADLAAIVSFSLQELAREIRNGNTDQYKQFWNVDQYARPDNPRPEDACRDTLLERLKDRLRPLGIEAIPEGHYADNKRADIRISYTTPQTSMAVPIEVKRDSHPDLWTAMSDQLIALYTREPEAKGRGIFLAFWFGGDGMPTPPTGSRPTNAKELEAQLLSIRPPDNRELISVCVVDCAKSDK